MYIWRRDFLISAVLFMKQIFECMRIRGRSRKTSWKSWVEGVISAYEKSLRGIHRKDASQALLYDYLTGGRIMDGYCLVAHIYGKRNLGFNVLIIHFLSIHINSKWQVLFGGNFSMKEHIGVWVIPFITCELHLVEFIEEPF